MGVEPSSDDRRTEELFTIHQQRLWMLLHALALFGGAVFLAAIGLGIIGNGLSVYQGIINIGFGIFCVGFSFICGGLSLLRGFRAVRGKREIIAISSEGLQVFSGEWFRWDDIRVIGPTVRWRTEYLLFKPTDVEAYLARQSLWKRMIGRVNQISNGAPIVIAETGTPISLTELSAHIRRYKNHDSDEYEPADHSPPTSKTAGTTDESLEPYTTGTVEAVERVRNAGHTKLEFDVRLASGYKTTVTATDPRTVTTEPPVTRLLEERDLVMVDNLVGQEITLERSGELNDHYVLSVPTDARFISLWWIYGVIACLIGQIPVLIHPTQLWLDVFFITYVLAPLFMYLDTRYVRAESEWDPSSSHWARWSHWPEWTYWPGLMLIAWINVPLGLVYLYKRWQAAFRPQ